MPRYSTPSGKKESKIYIGENLRKARENTGKTQAEVERDLKILQKRLSTYENDIHSLPLEALKDLSKYYGVTVDYLIFGEDLRKNIVDNIKDKELVKYFEILDLLDGEGKEIAKQVSRYVIMMNRKDPLIKNRVRDLIKKIF